MLRCLVAGFRYVKPLLVGREGDPFWAFEIPCHNTYVATFRIEAVNRGRPFGDLPTPFIIVRYSIERIGEPDRAVGFHDNVVRSVQPLAIMPIDQSRDLAVIFGSVETSSAM